MALIAGVDEVGRGPLAGPVVAAAVICDNPVLLNKMKDSKKLTAKAREKLCSLIMQDMIWGVGEATVEEIDALNILQASLLAMQRAVEGLTVPCDTLWVDGIHAPKLPHQIHCFVDGDNRFPLISAASILAKVTRDKKMCELAKLYPEYGFEKHMGYGTKAHMEALKKYGVTPIHRKSFKPVHMLYHGHS